MVVSAYDQGMGDACDLMEESKQEEKKGLQLKKLKTNLGRGNISPAAAQAEAEAEAEAAGGVVPAAWQGHLLTGKSHGVASPGSGLESEVEAAAESEPTRDPWLLVIAFLLLRVVARAARCSDLMYPILLCVVLVVASS